MSKKVKQQPAIRLSHFYAKKFVLSNESGNRTPKNLDISVNQGVVHNKSDKRKLSIVFEVALENRDEGFELNCLLEFEFETDKDISNAFLESPFITQSAPAIAFPYVRSMISSLTINAGLSPIIIPTYNFSK